MILIFSQDKDASTDSVIDYLLYFKQEFLRINDISLINILLIDLNKNYFEFKYLNTVVKSTHIKSYWYRRGPYKNKEALKEDSVLVKTLNILSDKEKRVQLLYIFKIMELNVKVGINSFFNSEINKLFQLNIAKLSGLKIPRSVVTNNFDKIAETNLITKSLYPAAFLNIPSKLPLTNYTNILNKNKIKGEFAPSFIQESIKKKYDIRVFYLNKKCYSMAIFSQQNKKTITDFRRYDHDFPNRRSTFKLPKSLENKLINFMGRIGLNCGSIDFIYSADNQFYFLEVNPVGQFGMVSHPCNYNLELLIAQTLSK